MNYNEGNKLIAEFMGYESYEFREYTMFVYEEDNHRTHIDLHYHTSWSWLMLVINKCLIGEAEQDDDTKTIISEIYDAMCSQNISYAHTAVVDFIKKQTKKSSKTISKHRCIHLPDGGYIQIKYGEEGVIFDRYDEYDEHQECYGYDMYEEINLKPSHYCSRCNGEMRIEDLEHGDRYSEDGMLPCPNCQE